MHTAYLSAGKIARILPCAVPCRLVESAVCLVHASLIFQCQAEVVYRLPVIRVGVAFLEYGDSLRQIFLGQVEAPLADIPQAHGVVAAHVVGVAAQTLLIVVYGRVCGVAVLLEMEPCQEELLYGLYLAGKQCGLGCRGDGTYLVRLGVPCHHRAPLLDEIEGEGVERSAVGGDCLLENLLGAHGDLAVHVFAPVVAP